MLSLYMKVALLAMLAFAASCSKKVSNYKPVNKASGPAIVGNAPVRQAVILLQPQSLLDQDLGTSVEFSVLVSGEVSDVTFTWYQNEKSIPNSNTPVMYVDNITLEAEGTYYVTILNKSGTAKALHSDRVSLTIKPVVIPALLAPVFTNETDFVDREVDKTSNQSYTAIAMGDNLEYTWYFRPLNSTQTSYFILANRTNKLLLNAVTDENAGSYYVTVSNEAGSITSQVSVMTMAEESPPVIVPDPEPVYLQNQVAAGLYHSCGIKGGALYCWGYNSNISQGHGVVDTYFNKPTIVNEMTSGVTQVVAGSSHTCALKDARMYCWGYNGYGQVGNGSSTSSVASPFEVQGISNISSIAAGEHTSCAISDGKLICWGRTGYDLMGDKLSQAIHYYPRLEGVEELKSGVTAVALGAYFNCAIKNGALLCWGYNGYGQLGDGITTQRAQPRQVSTFNSDVTAVSVGLNHACAIHQEHLKCWGYNYYGQVGGNRISPHKTIQTITENFGEGILSLNEHSSCAYSFDNKSLKCWGWNGNGQVGVGNNVNADGNLYVIDPKAVQAYTSDITSLKSLSSSIYRHTCFVAGDTDEFHCWGYNGYRQVGQKFAANVLSPSLIQVIP